MNCIKAVVRTATVMPFEVNYKIVQPCTTLYDLYNLVRITLLWDMIQHDSLHKLRWFAMSLYNLVCLCGENCPNKIHVRSTMVAKGYVPNSDYFITCMYVMFDIL